MLGFQEAFNELHFHSSRPERDSKRCKSRISRQLLIVSQHFSVGLKPIQNEDYIFGSILGFPLLGLYMDNGKFKWKLLFEFRTFLQSRVLGSPDSGETRKAKERGGCLVDFVCSHIMLNNPKLQALNLN